jgi:hypothetical protein
MWYALLGIGLALVAFGIFLGLFALANDGLVAGVRLLGTSAAFGCAFVATGSVFRHAAEVHLKHRPWRWWFQVLPVPAGYVAFGIAASVSSALDRW